MQIYAVLGCMFGGGVFTLDQWSYSLLVCDLAAVVYQTWPKHDQKLTLFGDRVFMQSDVGWGFNTKVTQINTKNQNFYSLYDVIF